MHQRKILPTTQPQPTKHTKIELLKNQLPKNAPFSTAANKQTKLELKRLAQVNKTIKGFVIDGAGAVSDVTLKAVADAMK